MLFSFVSLNLKTRRYFYFSGRSPRIEYIGYLLFLSIANSIGAIFGYFFSFILGSVFSIFGAELLPIVAFFLFMLYINFPIFTISVRRLHDVGISGLWFIAPLILGVVSLILVEFNMVLLGELPVKIANFISILSSVIEGMVFFICVFVKGGGENKYGPNPLSDF